MIRIGTIYPERLNLNGDQGNILALTKLLRAAGFAVEVVPVLNTEQALHCNFVLLGHGSMAAMESIDGVLGSIDFANVLAQIPGMAVGSGYEYLSRKGFAGQAIVRGERESEFQVGTLGTLKALGYRNTDSGLPNLALASQWICSMLHGPVLAKNPGLLYRAARAAVASAGLEWPGNPSDELRGWVATLNDVAARLWAFETEETFEPLAL
jgi:CobQ-like glutamine amidotransferase family enzyme